MQNPLTSGTFAALCCRVSVVVLALAFLISPAIPQTRNPDTSSDQQVQGHARTDNQPQITIVSTSGPRATFTSFLRLAEELETTLLAYKASQSRARFDEVIMLNKQFRHLFNLENIPILQRSSVVRDTVGYMLDTLSRLDLPPVSAIPDRAAMGISGSDGYWRIPGTGFTIARMVSGPADGEYVFTSRTVSQASFYYTQVRQLPPRSSRAITNWREVMLDLHGPYIPAKVVDRLPDSFKTVWFEIPAWKLLLTALLLSLAVLAMIFCYYLFHPSSSDNELSADLRRLVTPAFIVSASWLARLTIQTQVILPGALMFSIDLMSILMMSVAGAWFLWVAGRMISELIIRLPAISDQSLDANLLRMMTKIICLVGAFTIIGLGAHVVGIPAFGVLAGFGVGGIAAALAIRPTLENLFSGIALYIDGPVRVGDFCTFDDHTGTVERIGARSTQIRALDRTVVSIPNSSFAELNIVNWAQCDRMLIDSTLGLRYETKLDQLRFVLAKLREMCVAHPKIESSTVRIRFVEYASSSLDINMRVFALTNEWNEFFAIREDVLLRVAEIVDQSGSAFAFPSQTLYVGKDSGLDDELGNSAEQEVESWRQKHRFPFPTMSEAARERIQDTLDYPPRGAPSSSAAIQDAESAETLRMEPDSDESEDDQNKSKPL